MDGVRAIEYNLNQQAVVSSSETGNIKVQDKQKERSGLSTGTIKDTKEKTNEKNTPEDIDIQSVVAKLNDTIKFFNAKITFSYDPRINRSVILVVDSVTGEIIRQIPPEEMILLISKLQEIAGLLFNKKV